MKSLSKILKHQDYQVIKQLFFDFDLIEVFKPKGKCFSFSRRDFVDFSRANQRSPRAFLAFNSEATELDAGYFQEGIDNSFPDKYTRIAFLNKFYQCLCVGKMPQKCRKLVSVEGPRDSGQDNIGECISSHNSITICCFHYSEETVQRFNAK